MRHGTTQGYWVDGCREDCCRRAAARAENIRRMKIEKGIPRLVDRSPSIRKVKALVAMGWTLRSLADEHGRSPNYFTNFIIKDQKIPLETHHEVDKLFRRLEMRVGPSARAMRNARSKGWKTPMAWDDIDAGLLARDDEVFEGRPFLDRFDEDEIEYALQYHDFTRRLNKFEKSEIIRRWVADGRSENSLCRLTGWREGRYRDPRPTQEEAA